MFLKKFNKAIFTCAAALLIASSVTSVTAATTFTDVSTKYQEAVEFVVSKGNSGFTPTEFGTDQNIKRVDAAVMLVRVLGLDIESAPTSGFTDVPDRAVKYVNALKQAGITSGKTDTTFDSQSEITRGELAIWIQRGFKLAGNADTLEFTDVGDRYKEAVSALVGKGITSGTSTTAFGTTANAKRGDYAIFLFRADEAVDDQESTELEVIDIY